MRPPEAPAMAPPPVMAPPPTLAQPAAVAPDPMVVPVAVAWAPALALPPVPDEIAPTLYPVRPDGRTERRTTGSARVTGHRRALGAAFAVVGIIVVAGVAIFALNSCETTSAGGTPAAPKSAAAQFSQRAETALTAGDLGQAAGLYSQAIQADIGYEAAYYGKWDTLVAQDDYARALTLASQATRQFPTSRQAWFELGFVQETQGQPAAAVQSYTTCLQYAQGGTTGGKVLDDATVRERLDLVTYVAVIADPRGTISDAVAKVNSALQATIPDTAALSSAVIQANSVLSTNIALLRKVAPLAYFADFHSGMLTAYDAIKTACEALATATSSNDAALVSAARESLNNAIGRFNQNDRLGSSLLQSYYAQ